jgi:predicted ATPase
VIRKLHVSGYRSLRDFHLQLGSTNVVTGGNGTGKSNLYRALVLLARAASGQFARAVSEEGGMSSVLWAGGERIRYTRRKLPVRIRLALETDWFSYEFAAGLPSPSSLPPGRSLFGGDPEVKEEILKIGDGSPRVVMLERKGPTAWLRNVEGRMEEYPFALLKYESVLAQIREPHRYPELSAARAVIEEWRFYHQFRTDAQSPLRFPQPGVQTPVLSPSGDDLAAALETIVEVGDAERLERAVADAFDRAAVQIESNGGLFSFLLSTPGLLRPLSARELSDGQLRFLCLCAALLSPRAPALLALNEPEASLHPDLFEPLADLISAAARQSQLWVTTHSRDLAGKIADRLGARPLELELMEGETRLAGDPNTPRRPHRNLHFAPSEERHPSPPEEEGDESVKTW